MRKTKVKINLLEGNILIKLLLLSAPLMATAFVNMAYNMTDTAWLGRLGKEAVASVGTAHFFVWIATSLGMISRVGTSIYAAQEYGKKDNQKVINTIKNGLVLVVIIVGLYTVFINMFSSEIMDLFKLDATVKANGVIYLKIMSIGLIVTTLNLVISSVYNSLGNSFVPFVANVIGLILNIFLDPILIFGYLGVPAMGVAGAAYASVLSQFIVLFIILIDMYIFKNEVYEAIFYGKLSLGNMYEKFVKGLPSGLMNLLHALVSLTLARFVSIYGTIPVAVVSVGVQIEAITWMTTEGFSGGIVAFVGQNYGAGLYKRLKKIIKISMINVLGIGLFGTVVLMVFGYQIFSIFVPNNPETISIGAKYLLILGASQLFMAAEIASAAVFNGLGKTKTPALVSVIFNILRIPLALILMPNFIFYGVWIAMSVSSIIKGIVNMYFLRIEYKLIQVRYPITEKEYIN